MQEQRNQHFQVRHLISMFHATLNKKSKPNILSRNVHGCWATQQASLIFIQRNVENLEAWAKGILTDKAKFS